MDRMMAMLSSTLRSDEVLPSLAPKSATITNQQDIPSFEVGVYHVFVAEADVISMLENLMKAKALQFCPGAMGS